MLPVRIDAGNQMGQTKMMPAGNLLQSFPERFSAPLSPIGYSQVGAYFYAHSFVEICGGQTVHRSRRSQDQRQPRRCVLERTERDCWGHHLSLSHLIARIDSDRQHGNLSSAIRLFVLDFYREQPSRLKTSALQGRV